VDVGRLCQLLPERLDGVTAIVAPLPNDGHPDHDACGQAAGAVATRLGIPLYTYPVWAYHRAPGAVPHRSARRMVHLPPATLTAKRRAIACFASQFVPLGPAPEDGPVLAAGFRAPFERPYEVVYA
jgi:LmbE family N-acetylglucosaminyl deacetylase